MTIVHVVSTGVLSLITIDSNETRTNHTTSEFVWSSDFECLGHAPSRAVDLEWTIVDTETQTQTDILTDQSGDSLIATVGGNYLIMRFLSDFSGKESVPSRPGQALRGEWILFLVSENFSVRCPKRVSSSSLAYTCHVTITVHV